MSSSPGLGKDGSSSARTLRHKSNPRPTDREIAKRAGSLPHKKIDSMEAPRLQSKHPEKFKVHQRVLSPSFNEEAFHANIFLNHSQEADVKQMMQSVCDQGLNPELQEKCTVSAGAAFERYDEQIRNARTDDVLVKNSRDTNQDTNDQSDPDHPAKKKQKIELSIDIMRCLPSSRMYCQKTTMDLYRMFSQYFIDQNKYGRICNFVVEFIEGINGAIYFNQVKGFEVDYMNDGKKIDTEQPTMTQFTKRMSTKGGQRRGTVLHSNNQHAKPELMDMIQKIKDLKVDKIS